ncbi:unnamed protein product [Ilex paraguariensis]|uniref:Uncharacterized protein n=1 Tax=Ilex paraguariensis TaxID=185542 RepID=A0ABC8QMK4_9AQUA
MESVDEKNQISSHLWNFIPTVVWPLPEYLQNNIHKTQFNYKLDFVKNSKYIRLLFYASLLLERENQKQISPESTQQMQKYIKNQNKQEIIKLCI